MAVSIQNALLVRKKTAVHLKMRIMEIEPPLMIWTNFSLRRFVCTAMNVTLEVNVTSTWILLMSGAICRVLVSYSYIIT